MATTMQKIPQARVYHFDNWYSSSPLSFFLVNRRWKSIIVQEARELIAAAILPQEARKMIAISKPTNPTGKLSTTIDGHYIVNAFVNHDFGNGLSGSLNISNLFDNVYPANGAGFVGGSTTVLGAGVETGRAISATVRYSF